MPRLAADSRLPGLDGLVPLGRHRAFPLADAEGGRGLLCVPRFFGAPFSARIAGVAVHRPIVVPHQFARPGDVADAGRRVHDGVDEAASRIDADAALHAEVPLAALPGLVHLGVPFLFPVFRGAGGGSDGGVHNGPAAHHEALLLEKLARRLNMASARPCFSRRWRKCRRAVASGALPEAALRPRTRPWRRSRRSRPRRPRRRG